MSASVDVALRLEEILDRGFAVAVGLFDKGDLQGTQISDTSKETVKTESSNILSLLKDMGFNVLPISQAPFDAVSISTNRRDENSTILTGVGEYTNTMVKKARLMSSISEVACTQSLLIVHGITKMKNIERTVLVEDKELKKYSDKEDFIDLLQSRGRRIEVS